MQTGISKIDNLWVDKPTEPALAPGLKKDPAVGIVQDLLRGLFPDLSALTGYFPPSFSPKSYNSTFFFSSRYGTYDEYTEALVIAFKLKWNSFENPPWNIPTTDGKVDSLTLRSLAFPYPIKRFATPGYLAIFKQKKVDSLLKVALLIAFRECSCDFGKINPNSDKAGLSLGLIHWAQGPSRLYELIRYLYETEREALLLTFECDPQQASPGTDVDAVIAYLQQGWKNLYRQRKKGGPVLPSPLPQGAKLGDSVDPHMEFAKPISTPKNWNQCFLNMLADPLFQDRIIEFTWLTIHKMYDAGFGDYPAHYPKIPGQGVMQWTIIPERNGGMTSERAIAFLIDLANQFGGNAVTRYTAAVKQLPAAATDYEVLVRITNDFEAAKDTANANRRKFYLQNWYLKDAPFALS